MKLAQICFFCFLFLTLQVSAQDKLISRKQFFSDTAIIVATLKTDLKKLSAKRKNPSYQAGTLTWHNADSSGDVTGNIKVRLRGNFRRENCGLASLMVEFRDSTNQSRLSNLKNLKLVAPCYRGFENEQLIIKEFLVYKIYNEITDRSFKVRMMKLTFEDENDKQKPYTQYAFVIEPIDDLAKRHNCIEKEDGQVLTEQTNRAHTTLVMMFQYMIGNTDFGIPVYHNIKLMIPKDTPTAAPYVIPYDFDYCGLVNAPYAIPHESTGLTEVTERKNMGFARTMNEVQATADWFISRWPHITGIVENNDLLNNNSRNQMMNYLGEFLSIIKNESRLKAVFVTGVRTQ